MVEVLVRMEKEDQDGQNGKVLARMETPAPAATIAAGMLVLTVMVAETMMVGLVLAVIVEEMPAVLAARKATPAPMQRVASIATLVARAQVPRMQQPAAVPSTKLAMAEAQELMTMTIASTTTIKKIAQE